jgi:hypothetical protein
MRLFLSPPAIPEDSDFSRPQRSSFSTLRHRGSLRPAHRTVAITHNTDKKNHSHLE